MSVLPVLQGMEILFRVGVALLEWSREQLLQMDMEAMLRHFQKDMCTIHERDPEALIAAAYQVKYNTKKMKRYAVLLRKLMSLGR